MAKYSTIQSCPVCGTSWQGKSYVYIYRQADIRAMELMIENLRESNAKSEHPLSEKELQKQYPQPTPMEFIEQSAKQHKHDNQSRLMMSEDCKYLICPDCHTAFLISDFGEFNAE